MSSVAVRPESRRWVPARAIPRPGPELAFGVVLAAALIAVGLRSGGGLSLGPTTKTEMVFDVTGAVLGALAVLAAGVRRWWGGLTLAAFGLLALITALSITWAIEPSDAWLEANRTISYVAVFAAAMIAARLAGAWWTATVTAVVAAAGVICTWAILTKVFPGALAPEEVYARLREPFGYWNAVGLTAALGVPPTLWLGARRSGHAALNALAYPVMGVLLLTIMLSYSRGSLLAVALGCAFWFAVVPLRLRGVTVLAAGAVGALLVTAWVFSQETLTKDKVPLAERATSGHELGLALVVMVLVLLAVGLAAGFRAARRAPAPATRRRVGAAILVGLGLLPILLVIALSLSSKGLGGSISSGWKSLTDPNDKTVVLNDPSRLTSVGSVRARYWDESYKIFRAHPWSGVGAGGYGTARTRFRSDTLAVRHSHGYFVQTAADLGMAGLLASLALLIAWMVAAGRALGWRVPLPAAAERKLRRPPPHELTPAEGAAFGPERIALATLVATVVVFAVHSFVDWTWFVPGNAVVALVCAGWVVGRGPLDEPPTDGRSIPARVRDGARVPWRVGAALGVVVAGALATWAAWQPLGSVHAGNASLVAAGPTPKAYTKAKGLAETARSRNPLSIDPLLELAYVENVAGHRAAARNALEDAVRLQPSNPESWEHLARFALDQQDDPQQTLRLLGPALYLDPHSPTGAQDYLDATRRLATQAQERRKAREEQQRKSASKKKARR